VHGAVLGEEASVGAAGAVLVVDRAMYADKQARRSA
jgi:hypothetical protein